MRNLKSKKGGIVTTVVAGVGTLAILVVLVLVIVSTVLDADLLKSSSRTTVTAEQGWLNSSNPFVIAAWTTYGSHAHDYAISSVVNATGSYTFTTANYTFDSTTGLITNKTLENFYVNVTYTYFQPTRYEQSGNSLAENFTSGIGNVSAKLPTILLLAAVVLLLGVLAFLVVKSRQLSSVGGEVRGGSGGTGYVGNDNSSAVGGVGGGL